MHLPEEAELLRVFIGDGDRYHHKPLYEAIVEAARERHLAGATVLRGYLGYGAHSRIHTAKILRLSEDLPVVVEIVDEPEKIEAFLPVLDEMMAEGMVTVEPVRVITYRHHGGGRGGRSRRATDPRRGGARSAGPAAAAFSRRRCAALAACDERRAAAQASSGVAACAHGVDEGAADDDAVGEAGDAGRLLGRRDPEAHRERRVRALAQAREQRRQLGADLGAGAGDAGHGDAVDEQVAAAATRSRRASVLVGVAIGTSETPAPAASSRQSAGLASQRDVASGGLVERQVGDHEGFHAGASRRARRTAPAP